MIAKLKLDLLGMARHASHFSAGSVTFVGKKETWNIFRSSIVDIHGGNNGI